MTEIRVGREAVVRSLADIKAAAATMTSEAGLEAIETMGAMRISAVNAARDAISGDAVDADQSVLIRALNDAEDALTNALDILDDVRAMTRDRSA